MFVQKRGIRIADMWELSILVRKCYNMGDIMNRIKLEGE